MEPVAVWIALTISSVGVEQVDVGGAIVIDAPVAHVIGIPGYDERALTVGPVILSDPGYLNEYPEVLSHELHHVQQWEALGPGLALGYLMGGGQGFEDYLGDGTVWEPDERRCPVFRWQDGPQFMPCWF